MSVKTKITNVIRKVVKPKSDAFSKAKAFAEGRNGYSIHDKIYRDNWGVHTNIAKQGKVHATVRHYNNLTGKHTGTTYWPFNDEAYVSTSPDGKVVLSYYENGKEVVEQHFVKNLGDFVGLMRSKYNKVLSHLVK